MKSPGAAWLDAAREDISNGLDRASGLAPGSGKFELGLAVRPESLGGFVDLHSRLSPSWAVYARGHGLYSWRDRTPEFAAYAGVRGEW